MLLHHLYSCNSALSRHNVECLHRSRPDASSRHLREAAALLQSAAGVRISTSLPPTESDAHERAPGAEERVIEYDEISYVPPMRELAKAYAAGERRNGCVQFALCLLICSSLVCFSGNTALASQERSRGKHLDVRLAVGRHQCAIFAGEGVSQDMFVAAELMDRAADAGDPDALAEVGFRAALGLHPVTQTSFAFGEPDVPK